MKTLLTFLFGAVCGAGGMLVYLRKDIKKRLEAEVEAKKEEDVPFTVNDDKKNDENNKPSNDFTSQKVPMSVKKSAKVDYRAIYENANSTPQPAVVLPREEEKKEDTDDIEIRGGKDEPDVEPFEIDNSTFEHDHSFDKDRIVFYQGDQVMATEAGTIIPNPFILVGNRWESFVGHYANRTAFVRNTRLSTDYEIYVESGTYTDEYGFDGISSED